MAVVVVSWCQVVVCVTVVASSSGCHVASCDVAPLVGVNEEAGRGVVLLTWAGHDLAAVMSLLRCGGHSMVVVDGLHRHGFHRDSIWINPGKVKTSKGLA